MAEQVQICYLGDYPLYGGISVKRQQTAELDEIYCLGHYPLYVGIQVKCS